MKHRHAKLVCRQELQGAMVHSGLSHTPSGWGHGTAVLKTAHGTPGDSVPGRGLGLAGKKQHTAAATFPLASYCRPPREGFAAQGNEVREAPLTTCFQFCRVFSPRLFIESLAGSSGTQSLRITSKGNTHIALELDSIGNRHLFYFLKPLFPG